MSPSSTIKKRTSLITIIILLFSLAGQAQQNPVVSGRVYDAAKQPLPFADALVLSVQDSTVYKSGYTDESGRFEIADILPGNYILKISTIGYKEHSQAFSIDKDLILPDIQLSEAVKELESVVINSKRPVVKRKIDRLEFDVENSILSSDNAWEIIKKTPGVSMASGGISIRGSSGILVTINDKKVYLTGTELKNLLENTSGEDIKSIEVITTPPAKYEAQGSAVLNIKMRKNITGGYKGSVTGAYVQSMYPKGVISTGQYYKNKKLTLYGGYSFGSGHYYGENKGEVKYFDEQGQTASVWKSTEKSHYRAYAQHSYNLVAEYQIDSLNTVSVGANGFSSLKSTALIDTPTYIYNGSGKLDSLYTTHNHRDYPQKNSTFNGSFEHKFNSKKKIALSSDYTKYYFNQDQGINTSFSLPNAAPHRKDNILSDDTRRIELLSIQADYNGQSGETNIETGVRYGTVKAENNFDYLNEVNNVPVPNPGLSNRFLYDETIFAGYIGADREFGKWGFKAGLRGEYTKLEGNSVTTAEVNNQDYFKVFPTLYTLYKASDNHQIGASYGKRIVRPQYSSLNPFRSYSTPYAYATGDPRLQPTIAHNLSLLYTFKTKYNFDLYYRLEKDPAIEIVYQDYATSTTITQITNIDKNMAIGLDFNTNIDFFDWWQNGVQTTVAYIENTFQGMDKQMYTNKKTSFRVDTNSRFTLNKKKDLMAEANFSYTSARADGAYNVDQVSSLSVSFKKIFLKGNGELSFIFSDIYKGEVYNLTTKYANQYSHFSSYGDSQSFRIQFRYRFGNQKLGNGKSRGNTDEQNRL